MTWANRITILRILLIPVFVGLLLYYAESQSAGEPDEWLRRAALFIFIIAAVSDGIDGYLARHWNQKSKLGAVLDPIADKLLMLSSLVMLTIVKIGDKPAFPLWFPLIVISRDAILLVGTAILHFMMRQVEVRPHFLGKAATFFQLIAVGLALIQSPLTWWICALGAFFTIVSTAIYLSDGVKQLKLSGYAQSHGSSLEKDE